MVFGKHINKYYLKYLYLLLLGAFWLVLVDYYQLDIPKIYGKVVNGINGQIEGFNIDYVLNEICFPMFNIVAIMVVGRCLWRLFFFGTGTRVVRDMRVEMFNHCKDLPLEYYHKNKVGDLMSLFTNDLDTIDECSGWGIMMLCDAVFLGGMSLYRMFQINVAMSLLCIIPMTLLLIVGTILGNRLEAKWDDHQKKYSDLCDFSQESFSGIAVIKAFVKELKEQLAFAKLNKANEQAEVSFTKANVLLERSVWLFVESVICIILGFGSYLAYKQIIDAGQLVEYIGYFSSVVWPIMAVTEIIAMVSRGKASLKRISELLDSQNNVCSNADAQQVQSVDGKIQFNNLTFRYPGADYDALSNVSFVINAGERVGIVGKTGCGKTTVADLILRCYNVPQGSLLIDDKDVNSITIDSLRNFCAYVPQDNFLFSDTIANNIAFSNKEATLEQITNSAKLSDVDGNICEFAQQYDTVLGERGVTISGGQKQRISIARALLKDAPILILDDSVSAVDTDTEKVIINNLTNTRKGKTTLLIAHRISTVQNLDKIILLDNGTVVDVGTHQQLLSRCKDYQTMVKLQELEKEDN